MLHAAAMLTGLFFLWLLATQRWGSIEEAALAAGVAAACVLVSARLGGVSAAYARAPGLIWAAFARTGEVARGVWSTLRAALAADVTLRPALVRIKTRATRAATKAAFADALSATPGMAVVETDPDGLLAHVIDEESVDPAELGRVEARLMQFVEGGARR
jgi:multisubunit Na+/H+ antiporter MnhE subunit